MVVLLIALFFYGSTDASPRVVMRTMDSPEACLAAGPMLKAQAEARSDVRVAKWACFSVSPEGEKS